MSSPDIPALRMRSAAAASPPNPPPTICARIGLLPGLRVGRPPARACSSKQREVELIKKAKRVQAVACCQDCNPDVHSSAPEASVSCDDLSSGTAIKTATQPVEEPLG